MSELFVPLDQLSDDALVERYAPGADDWLRVNFVTSVDGAVTVDGYSEGLSCAPDKRVFGMLRMRCDALMVAAGTLRHEGYGPIRLDERRRDWRRAHGRAVYPTLIVVSGSLDLDPANPALTQAPVPPIILTHRDSPPDRRRALASVATIMVYGESQVDWVAARRALAGRGLREVLCEGGPHLLGALTRADQVDELDLTVSPLLAGPGAARITAGEPGDTPPRRMLLRHGLHANSVLILRYDREQVH